MNRHLWSHAWSKYESLPARKQSGRFKQLMKFVSKQYKGIIRDLKSNTSQKDRKDRFGNHQSVPAILRRQLYIFFGRVSLYAFLSAILKQGYKSIYCSNILILPISILIFWKIAISILKIGLICIPARKQTFVSYLYYV